MVTSISFQRLTLASLRVLSYHTRVTPKDDAISDLRSGCDEIYNNCCASPVSNVSSHFCRSYVRFFGIDIAKCFPTPFSKRTYRALSELLPLHTKLCRSDDGRTNAWALAMNVIRLLHVPLELGFNLFTLFWTLAVDYEYRAMVSPS
ncbi:hypothetical protein D9757_014780 [Collybiopsis confluens]|uniref:Uncharacterized protein n=1 Tax=Collybiopsis confluens TaxID=2823264 RepID=A0A8H5CD48_9AGAR|nr:hypothetical protein D9757_014780 [Collybiopsis confluens]